MCHTVTFVPSPRKEEGKDSQMLPVSYGTTLRDGPQRGLQVQRRSLKAARLEAARGMGPALLRKVARHEEPTFKFYYI